VSFRPKEGNRDRWEIIVDGEKWREGHRAIFGRKPVFPPISTEKDLQRLFDAFEYRRVKGYVLWRLSTQSYHSEQLAKLLRDRLVQDHTIDRVIQEYREMGVLDDDSWLQSFMRTQQKRYSLRFILNKLHAKGFSSETIQRLAIDWKNPDEELQAIQHLIRTRYRSKDLKDYKSRQKVIASLARKGYAFDQIQTALKQYQNEEFDD
jgi:regulatory protein